MEVDGNQNFSYRHSTKYFILCFFWVDYAFKKTHMSNIAIINLDSYLDWIY